VVVACGSSWPAPADERTPRIRPPVVSSHARHVDGWATRSRHGFTRGVVRENRCSSPLDRRRRSARGGHVPRAVRVSQWQTGAADGWRWFSARTQRFVAPHNHTGRFISIGSVFVWRRPGRYSYPPGLARLGTNDGDCLARRSLGRLLFLTASRRGEVTTCCRCFRRSRSWWAGC